MKKTFFMVGILAALSMTAFGAESESPLTIPITGSSLTPVTISSNTASIDFGKVIVGKTKKSGDIVLNLAGTENERVTLTKDIKDAAGVTMAKDLPLEPITLTLGKKDVTIELEYTPTTAGQTLNGSLVLTAEYTDAAKDQI
ncbi:hypothetical protein [Fusobacterium varium]|jgi:hypothetical protein|uniref:hypothetical protein n=1 Tax=Fusobacterium varium TaxID=856 RepID=UPI00241D6CA9|nr:hypothetical protein [Fusobacterium varium]